MEANYTIITPDNFAVVTNAEGNIIASNNKLLLSSKADGTCVEVDLTSDIMQLFHVEELVHAPVSALTPVSTSTKKKCIWTRASTLCLIDMLRKNEKELKSTSMKNDTVYKNISETMQNNGYNFTTNQVKDKLKYLKMRYMKKKDNMKTTGSSPIYFEFYEELDLVWGKKPNVQPVIIASSISRVKESNEKHEHGEDILQESTETPPKKKIRKEDDIERRHRERMALQERAIDSFENIMNKMIEKMPNPHPT